MASDPSTSDKSLSTANTTPSPDQPYDGFAPVTSTDQFNPIELSGFGSQTSQLAVSQSSGEMASISATADPGLQSAEIPASFGMDTMVDTSQTSNFADNYLLNYSLLPTSTYTNNILTGAGDNTQEIVMQSGSNSPFGSSDTQSSPLKRSIEDYKDVTSTSMDQFNYSVGAIDYASFVSAATTAIAQLHQEPAITPAPQLPNPIDTTSQLGQFFHSNTAPPLTTSQSEFIMPSVLPDGTLKRCTNCYCIHTPSWRRSCITKQLLCNACGL